MQLSAFSRQVTSKCGVSWFRCDCSRRFGRQAGHASFGHRPVCCFLFFGFLSFLGFGFLEVLCVGFGLFGNPIGILAQVVRTRDGNYSRQREYAAGSILKRKKKRI